MVVIFLFSSQDADASGGLSRCMTEGIYTAICSIWVRKPPDMASPLAGLLEVLLRKAAHLSVFFVFGVCTANAARQLAGKARNAFWVSLCWCSAYAATDEWHQYFVPGRAGMWQDWAIDTAGALLGIGAVAFLASRRRAKA
jgi:VanZ family protein